MNDSVESLESAARIAGGATFKSTETISIFIFDLIYFFIAARILSLEEMGLVVLFSIFLALLDIIGGLGLTTGVIAFISKPIGKGKMGVAKHIVRQTSIVAVSMGFLLMILWQSMVLVALPLILIPIGLFPVFIVTGFIVFPRVANQQFDALSTGLQRFKGAFASNVIGRVTGVILSLYLIIAGWSILGVVIGWLIGEILRFFLFILVIGSKWDVARVYSPFIDVLRFSAPFYIFAIMAYFIGNIERYVVIFFLGLDWMALYSAALTITSALTLLPGALSKTLYPEFCRIYSVDGEPALKSASIRASKLLTVILIPIFLLAASLSPTLVTILGGINYLGAALPMTLMAIGLTIASVDVVLNAALLSLNENRVFFERGVVGLVTDLLICLLLVPWIGLIGAAVGNIALRISAFVYAYMRMVKVSSIRFDWKAILKAIFPSIIFSLVVMLAILLNFTLTLILLFIGFGLVAWACFTKLLSILTESDIEILVCILPSKLRSFVRRIFLLLVNKTK